MLMKAWQLWTICLKNTVSNWEVFFLISNFIIWLILLVYVVVSVKRGMKPGKVFISAIIMRIVLGILF